MEIMIIETHLTRCRQHLAIASEFPAEQDDFSPLFFLVYVESGQHLWGAGSGTPMNTVTILSTVYENTIIFLMI